MVRGICNARKPENNIGFSCTILSVSLSLNYKQKEIHMRIKVEQIYSNGWRGKSKGNDLLSIAQLRELAKEKHNEIISLLSEDEKIKVTNMLGRDVLWNMDSMTDTDPPFEQFKVVFYIDKSGRSLYSATDITKIVNSVEVSVFTRLG